MIQGMSRDAWNEFSKTILVSFVLFIFVEPFTWILLCHYRGSFHTLRGVFLAFQLMP